MRAGIEYLNWTVGLLFVFAVIFRFSEKGCGEIAEGVPADYKQARKYSFMRVCEFVAGY
jgi:hypothetical protein